MITTATRSACVLFLFISTMGLHQAVSLAEATGSNLTQPLGAGDIGESAVVGLETVEGFPTEGATVVLEPGTENEETIGYGSVDADAGHLKELSRPSPLDHPQGAYAQLAQESPSPTPSPTSSDSEEIGGSEEESQSETDESSAGDPSSGQDGTTSDDSTSGVIPEACDMVAAACELVGDPCAANAVLCEVIEDLPDPCDPGNEGQTCMGVLEGLLNDLPDLQEAIDRICDPMGTGRTCQEMIDDLPTLDEVVDGVCDPANTGQTCQEMIEDLVSLEEIVDQLCDADGCVTTLPHPNSLLAELTNTCYAEGGLMGCVNEWLLFLPTGDCPTVVCVPPPKCLTICPEDGETGTEEPVLSEPPPREGEWVDIGPHACRLIMWSPWKWDTNPSQPGEDAWVYITFKGRADCTPYAPARMHEYGSRSRWYGWQTMVHDDLPVYQTTGNRTVKLDMHCNSWSAGTYDWLSRGIISIQSNSGTKLIEGVGESTPRYTCKDTTSGS